MTKQTKPLQTGCSTCALENPLWPMYDSPKCIYCTARLIQSLDKLRSPTSSGIAVRQRVVLQDAVAYGHSETEIRRLAKLKALAFEPVKG